ncbi:MAG: hypothetical protein QOF40_1950 [Actinomycetota bacterium]|nr:hypothetical protein [Actinomycetota bacterium]
MLPVESREGNRRQFRKERPEEAFSGLHFSAQRIDRRPRYEAGFLPAG